MKTRIVWTQEERLTIKDELIALFKCDLNLTRKQVLSAAQLKLPYERRRVVTDQTAFHERLVIEAARNRARTAVFSKPEQVCRSPYCECAPGECKNGLADMRGTEPSPAPTAVTAQPLQQVIKSELGAALEHLIDLVVDRVVARVQSRLVTEKAASAPAPVAVPSFDPALARANLAQRSALPTAEHRPRPGVLIIGLLGAQVIKVIEAYPHLDITHMTGEEGNTRPALLRAHTILMTKFINHSVQGKYRKAPNLHFCHGGVTELCRVLQDIGAKAAA